MEVFTIEDSPRRPAQLCAVSGRVRLRVGHTRTDYDAHSHHTTTPTLPHHTPLYTTTNNTKSISHLISVYTCHIKLSIPALLFVNVIKQAGRCARSARWCGTGQYACSAGSLVTSSTSAVTSRRARRLSRHAADGGLMTVEVGGDVNNIQLGLACRVSRDVTLQGCLPAIRFGSHLATTCVWFNEPLTFGSNARSIYIWKYYCLYFEVN